MLTILSLAMILGSVGSQYNMVPPELCLYRIGMTLANATIAMVVIDQVVVSTEFHTAPQRRSVAICIR